MTDVDAYRRQIDGLDPDAPTGEDGGPSTTHLGRDPRCHGTCTGSDRPVWDSPAKQGRERGTGRKVIYCTCCNRQLMTYEETLTLKGVQWYTTNIRPPNLNPELTADQQRYVDIVCRYDVILLRNIKPG